MMASAPPVTATPADAALEGVVPTTPRSGGPAFHPVLIEVAGCMEDPVVREMTRRLRHYRNRYQPLLRCMSTLVATAVAEAHLFGDDASASAGSTGNGCGPHSSTRGIFSAPRYAVTVNKTHPLVTRFYPTPAPAVPVEASATTSPCWADVAPQPVAQEGAAARAVERLEDFMAYHFLPLAMTHNTPPLHTAPVTPQSVATSSSFVLRQYTNEACRTASFLVADPFCARLQGASEPTSGGGRGTAAALVDPRAEQVECYLRDLQRLELRLDAIIFTHCFVDGATGLAALRQRFPDVRVLCGVPLAPAGTVEEVQLSPRLRLRTVRVPAFSHECQLVELHWCDALAALFTGVLWSTDAVPRWDFLRWSAFPPRKPESQPTSATAASTGTDLGDRDTALSHTHAVLQRHFFEPYFALLCRDGSSGGSKAPRSPVEEAEEGEEEEAQPTAPTAVAALQRVVMLPTHGGYSNVTNQLDLYWAAHLGDLARMKHTRVVLDTIAGPVEAFVKYCKRLPPLPHPPLFDASRVTHLRELLAALLPRATPPPPPPQAQHACIAQLPADMQAALLQSFAPCGDPAPAAEGGGHGGAAAPTQTPPSWSTFVNLIDVRDAAAYHARHLGGAVNVPMSFPGVAYGARRAELWLQCLLVPFQPILALCTSDGHRDEVHRRLAALSPQSCVRVFTLAELAHASPPALPPPLAPATPAEEASAGAALPWREVPVALPSNTVPADVPLPPHITWIERTGSLNRLTSYEHLAAIEPAGTRVVLDVRTPYEFKNGSHQHSVHVELAQLCVMAVQDALSTAAAPRTPSPAAWTSGSSVELADRYMETVHTTALLAGLPVVPQATSLSDVVIYCAGGYRSLIAESLLQRALEASATPAWRALRIADVSGGAFQIMTQRPDLWRVKDRSIICIS